MEVLHSLSLKRAIFHSEADFQHALAWEIHQYKNHYKIRLEYNPNIKGIVNMHIDIFIEDENWKYGIELKYKTKKAFYNLEGEIFNIKGHSAQDCARYDYLLDVERLEKLSHIYERKFIGYAIFLTNDHLFWDPPANEKTIDKNFRIHQGRNIHGSLQWVGPYSLGTVRKREGEISISGEYDIRWNEYSVLEINDGNEKDDIFNYCCLKV